MRMVITIAAVIARDTTTADKMMTFNPSKPKMVSAWMDCWVFRGTFSFLTDF